jgi:uncharacterized protein (DUF2236 family)
MAFRLPAPIQTRVEDAARALMSADGFSIDFATPPGASALTEPDSVSWRLFKNPISLFIGGVAAVLLELAEPRVRSGVWDHTSFRTDPVTRLRRTGLAAMVTVYASREVAEAMIEGVNRRHARVTGVTEGGAAYAADDPDLLDWVQATASYGFIEAYDRFVEPLGDRLKDQAFAEAAPAARLYGAMNAPTDQAGWRAALAAMDDRLEPSPVIIEFLEIIRRAPALPGGARLVQPMLVKAAVDLLPAPLRARLGLEAAGLSALERPLVRAMARAADRLVLESAPPARACVRMGLPADWLYRPPETSKAA